MTVWHWLPLSKNCPSVKTGCQPGGKAVRGGRRQPAGGRLAAGGKIFFKFANTGCLSAAGRPVACGSQGNGRCAAWCVEALLDQRLVNGHTMLNTPVLVRSLKLSSIGPGQYLDG